MNIELKNKVDSSKNYEVIFIVTPELDEAGYKKVVSKFEKMITDNGGTITNVEHWGKKRLAYPVEKKNSGYYAFIEFKGEGKVITNKLELEFIYDDAVIRFLTVRLDKHALLYNNKRREKMSTKKAEA